MERAHSAEDTLVAGAQQPASHTISVARVLLAVLGGFMALLLLSGAYLAFRYLPDGTVHVFNLRQSSVPWLVKAARTTHRISAWAVLVVALALVAIGIRAATTRLPRSGQTLTATAGAVVALLVAQLWSGPRLAWDALALKSIRVGQDIRGVFGLPARYMLVGYDKVSTDTYRILTWIHLLVVPVIIVLCGAILAKSSGRPARQTAREAPGTAGSAA